MLQAFPPHAIGNNIALLIIMLVCSVPTVHAGEKLTERVETALENYRQGDDALLDVAAYRDDPDRAAVLFLNGFHSFPKEKRRFLLFLSVQLALESVKDQPVHLRKTRDKELCSRWVKICLKDPSPDIRKDAASRLRTFVPPENLDAHAKEIRQKALTTQDHKIDEVTVLCALLPSMNLPMMRHILRQVQIDPHNLSRQRFEVDCLLARFGDSKAEDRVFTLVADGLLDWGAFMDYLVLIDTPRFQRRLAGLLRSEKIMACHEEYAVRQACALALFRMIRAEVQTPWDRTTTFLWDEELNWLEKWCTENLGVRYPETPRKKVGGAVVR